MTIRSDLVTAITANVTAYANYGISAELPFDSSGTPLYIKNMKRIYVDKEQQTFETNIQTLDRTCELDSRTTTVDVYLTTDAKTIPSDIDAVIAAIVAAKRSIGSTLEVTSEVTTEISDDYITYTIEFGFTDLVAT